MFTLNLKDVEEVSSCCVDVDEIFFRSWFKVWKFGYLEFVWSFDELLELYRLHILFLIGLTDVL